MDWFRFGGAPQVAIRRNGRRQGVPPGAEREGRNSDGGRRADSVRPDTGTGAAVYGSCLEPPAESSAAFLICLAGLKFVVIQEFFAFRHRRNGPPHLHFMTSFRKRGSNYIFCFFKRPSAMMRARCGYSNWQFFSSFETAFLEISPKCCRVVRHKDGQKYLLQT